MAPAAKKAATKAAVLVESGSEESEEEWEGAEDLIRINVGGGIENIWILKGMMIWAECKGKFYFHRGRGQPNEWHEFKPLSVKMKRLKTQIFKLMEEMALLKKKMLTKTTATKAAKKSKQSAKKAAKKKQ